MSFAHIAYCAVCGLLSLIACLIASETSRREQLKAMSLESANG